MTTAADASANPAAADPLGGSILFTAFEPSGDQIAAPVIRALLERRPNMTIYAWGGPEMEAAGAEIVERTGKDAVMGVPGLAKIQEHRKINERVEASGELERRVPNAGEAAGDPDP